MTDPVQLFEQMMAALPADFPYEIPPKIFLDMQGEIIGIDMEAKTLTAKYPVLERYQNPSGNMQGGMIVTAIDNTLGPLSFFVAPPSVTTQLNTSYIRPITADIEHIIVIARVTQKTRKWLYLSAEVQNPAGKVLAIAQATCSIVGK